jgi:hypothetical protein
LTAMGERMVTPLVTLPLKNLIALLQKFPRSRYGRHND